MTRQPLALAVIGIAAIVLGSLAAGCRSSEESEEAAPPAGGGPRAEIRSLLAAAAADAAARPADEITWYAPDNLYDYIDGQAEEFLDAGFVVLAHAEYRPKEAAGKAYVEVDLYHMGSAKGVTAVMEPPPTDSRARLAPGVQAYRTDGLCEFGAGPYYVRITARLDPDGLTDLVDGLARALATGITADEPAPRP